jgi:CRP-like cAMP-binding protein
VLEVSRQADGVSHRVGRISAGDYVGEIGMLTGEPRMAAVTALTPCTVFELRKADVAPRLAVQPELAHAFEAAVRRGQAMIERAAAASVGASTIPPGALLDRIRAFSHFDG